MRDEICQVGASLFDRGLTAGSRGNISVRLEGGGWLMTPTNVSLGALDLARLSRFDAEGRLLSGGLPTKEAFHHLSMYSERADATTVVHLHSSHATAVSILRCVDPQDMLPALTAHRIMRLGRVLLVPCFAPGDPELAHAVKALANRHHAVLLANHGPVVASTLVAKVQCATEELEETAKLFSDAAKPCQAFDDTRTGGRHAPPFQPSLKTPRSDRPCQRQKIGFIGVSQMGQGIAKCVEG
jgi:ribulose-5-phosphate 4-epimerase/fuculose-1-phosphate aldolase